MSRFGFGHPVGEESLTEYPRNAQTVPLRHVRCAILSRLEYCSRQIAQPQRSFAESEDPLKILDSVAGEEAKTSAVLRTARGHSRGIGHAAPLKYVSTVMHHSARSHSGT